MRAAAGEAGARGACPRCGAANVVPGERSADPRCPACGGAVAVGAGECGACGELLGPLGGGSAGPTAVTLAAVWPAAAADWRRLAVELGLRVFVTQILAVVAVSALSVGWAAVGAAAEAAPDPLRAVPVIVALCGWPLSILALGLWLAHGLAAAHLRVVRGAAADDGPIVPAGWPRTVLLGLPAVAFAGALVAVPPLVVGLFAPGSPRLAWTAWTAAGFVGPGAVFVGLWPVPFVAADRPGAGLVETLRAAFGLPDGQRIGAGAVSLAAWALLAGPVLAGPAVVVVGAPGAVAVGLTLAAPPVLCATVPPALLLLAHVHVRLVRAEERGEP